MLIIATNFKEFQNYSAERRNDLNHVLLHKNLKISRGCSLSNLNNIFYIEKKTIIPLVLGFVGDTVVAFVCEAFVGVVTKMNLKMFPQLVLTK